MNRPNPEVRRAIITTRCPHCGAGIGQRCVVLSSGKPLRESGCHPSRMTAASLPGAA